MGLIEAQKGLIIMVPYLIFFVINSFLVLFDFIDKKRKEFGFALSFILLAFLAGARYKIGGSDYNVYEYIYNLTPPSPLKIFQGKFHPFMLLVERGYLLINSIFKIFFNKVNYLFLAIGIFSSFLLIKNLKKYSKYVFLGVIIYLGKGYLYYNFVAMRQVIAMMVSWYALEFLCQKRFVPYFLLIAIVSTIHSSALIMIPMYFILNKKLSNQKVIILLISFFIIGITGLFGRVLELISFVVPFGDKIVFYLKGNSTGINIFNFIETIPILYFVLRHRNLLETKNPYFNLFFNCFIFNCIFLFGFFNFAFITRVKDYFLIGHLVILPLFLDCFKLRSEKILFILLIIFYFSFVFIRQLLTFDDGSGLLPYDTFLINHF